MSRQNKVNPRPYTQRGRLTPDDGAREFGSRTRSGPTHLAAGEEERDATAGASRRRRPRDGDGRRRRGSGADLAHRRDTSGVAGDEEEDRNGGGSGEAVEDRQVQHCNGGSQQGEGRETGGEARGDEDGAENRHGPQSRRRRAEVSEHREAPNELTALRPVLRNASA